MKDVLKAGALGLVTFIAIGILSTFAAPDGMLNRLLWAVLAPGFRAGHFIGELIYPHYLAQPQSAGWYLVPLMGGVGDVVQLSILWFVGIRLGRNLRSEHPQ